MTARQQVPSLLAMSAAFASFAVIVAVVWALGGTRALEAELLIYGAVRQG